jgi:Peptidase family S41
VTANGSSAMNNTRRYFIPALMYALTLWASNGLAAQPATSNARAFDPAPWQQDFAQLLSAMSAHYANLEWAIKGRHMDLVKLREQTQARLNAAHSDAEARTIFEHFLATFGDGHLGIEWQKTAAIKPRQEDQHRNLCQRLGYSARDNSAGLDFSLLPQFRPLAGKAAGVFPGGLLVISASRKVGVIRIGLFAESGFPQACEQVVQTLDPSSTSSCNADCRDKLQQQVADLLTRALGRRARELRRAGATRLLVDITGNGGGDNWVEATSRELSAVPLRQDRYAFVKSGHWTQDLKERLEDVDADLARHRGPRRILMTAHAQLTQAIAESGHTCDNSSVWTSGQLPCSQLVKNLLYTDALLPYAHAGSFTGLASREDLYDPLRYPYTESRNRVPLYVLVDGNTWSAAEDFAATLQDNHAATIIGLPTGGAGCGYTNGGIPTILKNSGASVKMPDCVRIRADGTNAVAGVIPDILVPWGRNDSPFQRANKLLSSLKSMR